TAYASLPEMSRVRRSCCWDVGFGLAGGPRERRCPSARWALLARRPGLPGESGAGLPGPQVLLLGRGEPVDGDAHGVELEASDLGVDGARDVVDAILECRRVGHDPLRRQ